VASEAATTELTVAYARVLAIHRAHSPWLWVKVSRMLVNRAKPWPSHSPKVENRSPVVVVAATTSQNSGKRK
jgi:hypothetical protein